MKVSRSVVLALLAAAGTAAPLAGQVTVTTRAAELAIGGRAQVQFSTTDQGEVAPALVELRRVRLDLAARVTPWISTRIQPEFGGGTVSLRDAYVALHLPGAHRLLIGQAHRPFANIPQASSTRMIPIERGARIRGLGAGALDHYNLISGLAYAERDLGVQLRSRFDGVPWSPTFDVGAFNGPLRGLHDEVTLQLAARGTVRPHPELRLGAGWSRRDFLRIAAPPAEGPPEAGHAFVVDLELGGYDEGLHLVAEAAAGDQNPFAGQEERFRSAQAWLAYRSAPRGPAAIQIEPLVRASYGRLDPGALVDATGGTLATLGVNVYSGPLNRLMINYDRWSPHGDRPVARSWKVMVQTAF